MEEDKPLSSLCQEPSWENCGSLKHGNDHQTSEKKKQIEETLMVELDMSHKEEDFGDVFEFGSLKFR